MKHTDNIMKIYILHYCCGDRANDNEVFGVFNDFNKLKKIIYEDTKKALEYHKDNLKNLNYSSSWEFDSFNKIIKEEQNIINHIFNCKDCYEVNNLCLDEYDLGYWCYEAELNKQI